MKYPNIEAERVNGYAVQSWILGNGKDEDNRHNAAVLTQYGDMFLQGGLKNARKVVSN